MPDGLTGEAHLDRMSWKCAFQEFDLVIYGMMVGQKFQSALP